MRARSSRTTRRSSATLLWAASLAGFAVPRASAHQPPRSEWAFSDLPDPTPQAQSDGTIQLTEVRRFGSEDGPGWLGRIWSAAANDSVLVVADNRACEFVVFARRTGRELTRFGKCGQGPGQFLQMQIATVALKQDTIVIADRHGARIQYLTYSGASRRTIRLSPSVFSRGTRMRRISWVGDTLMLFTVAQWAHSRHNGVQVPREPNAPFVRAVRVGNDQPMRFGALVEGRGVSQQNWGWERVVAACHTPMSHSSTQRTAGFITAVNDWQSQAAVLSVDSLTRRRPAAVMNRSVPLITGITPFVSNMPPGAKGTTNLEYACSASNGYFELRRYDPKSESGLAIGGWLVAVDPVERRQAVLRLTGAHATALGTLTAAHGNSLFYVHNSRFDYPQIIEMRATVTWNR